MRTREIPFVASFAVRRIDLANKSTPTNAHDREWLMFAQLIVDDGGER
jgi:hypothetical protein